jgi:hypothetical protein
MDSVPVEWIVNFATFCIAAQEWFYGVLEKIRALWNACKGVFQDKEYVFFEGSPHAYDAALVQTWASGSAVPRWTYNTTQKVFVAWNHVAEKKTYSVPYLSIELLHGDRVGYDLTDYIEKVKVRCGAGERLYPTLPEILAAWSTGSGIVLHPTRHFVRVVTDEGETKLFRLNDYQEMPTPAENPSAEAKED